MVFIIALKRLDSLPQLQYSINITYIIIGILLLLIIILIIVTYLKCIKARNDLLIIQVGQYDIDIER